MGIELPALTKACDECKGLGHRGGGLDAPPEDNGWCPDCEGTGTVGTEAGAQIMDLLMPAFRELRDNIDNLAARLDGLPDRREWEREVEFRISQHYRAHH